MRENYKLPAYFGVEIEFYLSSRIDIAKFEQAMELKIKQERGKHQFGIVLPPSNNLSNYANQILKLKIRNIASELGGAVDFRAKPFPNDGNSIHFNISLTSNIKIIEHAAKSLCHYMLDSFVTFMPNEEDYLRNDSRFMSPTHVLWR